MIEPLLTALGLDPDAPTETAGGATGRLWRVRVDDTSYALRLTTQRSQFAAMAAAHAAGLPVPTVLKTVDTPYGIAALLDWSPGVQMAQALMAHPENARQLGESVGAIQRRLNDIPAPPELCPPDDWLRPPGYDLPDGDSLLHLDFHWLNVLVDGTTVTAILDWENARRGPAVLDQARTWSLLTFEPILATLDSPSRELTRAVAAGWLAGYGITDVPDWATRWAAAAMLTDLTPRYADRPHLLDDLRSRT